MNRTATASTARSSDLPPGLVKRFAQAVARLLPGGGTLGLAVSGGTDSLAMMLLADAAMPGQFEVATVDHGLRQESASECAFVKEVAAARGIRCTILTAEVAGGNLQDRARAARYAKLAAWARERGLAAVATAHHADDQIETFVMRLNRGSGVAGLAAVRETGTVPGSDVALLRPMLAFRRGELEEMVKVTGLRPVNDPSNDDNRFDRVRLRKALAGQDLLVRRGVAASAAHLADAEEALAWAAEREWREQVEVREGEIRYAPRAPRAVALRVLARAIALIGTEPRGQGVAQVHAALSAGKGANVGGVMVRPDGEEWVFREEPARRTPSAR